MRHERRSFRDPCRSPRRLDRAEPDGAGRQQGRSPRPFGCTLPCAERDGAEARPGAVGMAAFPAKVDPKYASEPAGKQRMHTCLDSYKAAKAAGTLGDLKWIQKGGGYYRRVQQAAEELTRPIPAEARTRRRRTTASPRRRPHRPARSIRRSRLRRSRGARRSRSRRGNEAATGPLPDQRRGAAAVFPRLRRQLAQGHEAFAGRNRQIGRRPNLLRPCREWGEEQTSRKRHRTHRDLPRTICPAREMDRTRVSATRHDGASPPLMPVAFRQRGQRL